MRSVSILSTCGGAGTGASHDGAAPVSAGIGPTGSYDALLRLALAWVRSTESV